MKPYMGIDIIIFNYTSIADCVTSRMLNFPSIIISFALPIHAHMLETFVVGVHRSFLFPRKERKFFSIACILRSRTKVV